MFEGWICFRKEGGGREKHLPLPGSQMGEGGKVIGRSRLFGADLIPRNVTQSDVTVIVQ